MIKFTSKLEYSVLDNGYYKVQSAFKFYLNAEKRGEFIYIPEGFISNGASIPYFLQLLFNWYPMDIRWAQAAVIHDALVGETSEKIPVSDENGKIRYVEWNEATEWFNEALKVKYETTNNCPPFNRRLFIIAVKTWGVTKNKTSI